MFRKQTPIFENLSDNSWTSGVTTKRPVDLRPPRRWKLPPPPPRILTSLINYIEIIELEVRCVAFMFGEGEGAAKSYKRWMRLIRHWNENHQQNIHLLKKMLKQYNESQNSISLPIMYNDFEHFQLLLTTLCTLFTVRLRCYSVSILSPSCKYFIFPMISFSS